MELEFSLMPFLQMERISEERMRSRMEREFSKTRSFMRREVSLMRHWMRREVSLMRHRFVMDFVGSSEDYIDLLLRRLAMESKKFRIRKRIDILLKRIQMEEDCKRMKIKMEKEIARMKYFMEKEFLNMRKLTECHLMRSYRMIRKTEAEIYKEFSKMRSVMERDFSTMRSLLKREFSMMRPRMERKFLPRDFQIKHAIEQRKRKLKVIHDAKSRDDDASDREKQQTHKNYKPCHGSKMLKSILSLSSFFVPCVGGTGNGSSHHEHKDYSEIFRSSFDYVNNCPSPKEYMNKSLEKCAGVCKSYMQEGNCAYHCMRDSSKTRLVEFCARPKILFEYCPEYDPVDHTIQKDLATLCNSKFSWKHYNSSDIYFCDPERCLRLHESSVHTATTTVTTLMNETTEMNSGESQEWLIPVILVVVPLIVAIVLGCIFLRSLKMAKNKKRNGIQNENGKPLV